MLLREYSQEELLNLYPGFLVNLQDTLAYLSDGGTDYRINTAKISLKVATDAGTILPFIDKADAKQTVLNILGSLDRERLADVSKMLVTTANQLKINTFLSDDAREYLEKRKLARLNKPIKLVRVEEE